MSQLYMKYYDFCWGLDKVLKMLQVETSVAIPPLFPLC